MEDKYVLVTWPSSQIFMDYPWFRKECIMYNAFDEQEYLDSAYFIPEDRYNEVKGITDEVELLKRRIEIYESSLRRLRDIVIEIKKMI